MRWAWLANLDLQFAKITIYKKIKWPEYTWFDIKTLLKYTVKNCTAVRKIENHDQALIEYFFTMLKEGLEPSRFNNQRILSPQRLPIPPFEQISA